VRVKSRLVSEPQLAEIRHVLAAARCVLRENKLQTASVVGGGDSRFGKGMSWQVRGGHGAQMK